MSTLKQILKRDGEVAKFDSSKIEKAIWKAAESVGGTDKEMASKITNKVITVLEVLFKDDRIPTVEQINDLVEKILIEEGHAKTAKAFILYREQHAKMRAQKNVLVDVEQTMTEYLNQTDWRVNANANSGYSLGGLILNTSGKVTANYWLSHIYPHEIGQAHRDGDMHIHDLDMFTGYCAGWSLRALLEEGFNGVANKIDCDPPKQLSAAVGQMVNFLGTLQNEWAGAQAFSSFDTYLAPFVRIIRRRTERDLDRAGSKLTGEEREEFIQQKMYKSARQAVQQFVFNLNVPSRWGTQTPFTNITLDWTCPEDLRDKNPKVGGESMDFTFGELQEEMDIINRCYIEVMTEGDSNGQVFTFPIPTYNITPDFDWDHPNAELLFEMAAKFGMPYFQNFINSPLKPNMVRSMCCRLQLDVRELLARGNGLFGSAEMTGSIGVVTINLARIGYLNKGDIDGAKARIRYLMTLAKTSLELKRKVVQNNIDNGLLPYTKRYLGHLHNHFSTIGINGLNEMIRNFTDGEHDITDEYGQTFAEEMMQFMRDVLSDFQEETGNLYNLEATPAEGTTYRFAKEDKKRFSDILQAGTKDSPYYTNSSQLPSGYTDDVFDALDKQHKLQSMYTGGTVFHIYMGERVSSSTACKKLVKNVLTNYRLPYITITPTFSVCPKHGFMSGEHEYCPKCDAEAMAEMNSKKISTPKSQEK